LGRHARPSPSRIRRGRVPRFEPLEARRALSLGYGLAFGLGITGSFATLHANAIAEDSAGDLVVVGSFRGTVNFATGAGSNLISSTGNQDAFVAEYSATGALLWAETFRGQSSASVSEASAVAIDGSGNIEVAGSFSGSVNFNPAGSAILSAPSRTDAYAAKLDGSGHLLWASSTIGTTNNLTEAFAVAADGSGGLFFAGSLQGTASFGGTALTSTGQTDAFVAHMSSTGNFLWAKSTSGTGASTAEINGLAVDPGGRVVTSGFYAGTVNFDPNGGSTLLTSAGSRDALVWTLTGSGSLAWARGLGGPDFDQAGGVAVDPSGNIYVTGAFSASVNFNPNGSPIVLTAVGIYDVFVARLSSAGATAWAESFVGSTAASMGTGIGVDALGRIDVSGWFGGKVQFDPTGGTASVTAGGSVDSFAVGLAASGGFLDVATAGGSSKTTTTQAVGFALNASGTVATVGSYTGASKFGSTSLSTIGVASFFVATLNQTVSAVPPPGPPSLEAASDSGRSQTDGITNVTSPTFDLVATSQSFTLQLLRDGAVVASRTGSGPLTDPGRVPDGTHQYTARQVDAFGTVGPASTSTQVTIDATAPAAPATPGLLAADDTGTLSDGITSVNQPRITGTAEAGSSILLYNGAALLGSATAVGGAYTVQPGIPLGDGSYSITATATDAAGNTSSPSNPFTLVIDTAPPAAPSIPALPAGDDTGTLGDGITSKNRPHLIGSAEAGSTVQLYNGSSLLGSGTAVGGSYSILPNSTLADGTYSLTATATDAVGNTSPPSQPFRLTIDTTAPRAPSLPALLAADDSGTLNDGTTNKNQPRITGSAEAGSTVQLFVGASPSGSGIAVGGTYKIQLGSPLIDGSYSITATATDAAGNVSPPSSPFALVIDTTPPATPTTPALLAADDSGAPNLGLTNRNQPHLIGSAASGVTVQIYSGASLVGSAVAVNLSYSIVPGSPLAEGSYSLTATATDVAGNASPASQPFSLTIDTLAPAAPSTPALSPGDDSDAPNDGITNKSQPHLVGTAESGSTVRIYSGGSRVGAAVASGGSYSILPLSAFADGTYTLFATATDAAGNVSPSSTPFSLTIDTTPPLAPTGLGLLPADDTGALGDWITAVSRPRIIGNAETGTSVTLLDQSNNVVGQATASGGAFTLQPTSKLADGIYTLHAVSTDVAGNASPPSQTITLQILATPPAAPTFGLVSADDTGVKGDGVTAVRRPRLSGIAAAGSLVELLDAAGNAAASAISSLSGLYTLTTPAGAAGTFTYRLRATDVAGNVGALSASFRIRILDVAGDFDGDGRADVVTFNAATAVWTVRSSSTGVVSTYSFGPAGLCVPVAADYFGDGRTDLAVYIPSTADWYAFNLASGAFVHYNFGWAGLDLPVPGDYDGIGRADIAVYRPNTAQWFLYNPTSNILTTKTQGIPNLSVPVPADYDGDGKTDPAVYVPSTADWYILDSTTGTVSHTNFGWPGLDIPIPADYDGDGKADIAVYRPNTSQFFILQTSSGTLRTVGYGAAGIELAVPLDYDGDGKADIAIYQGVTEQFFVVSSQSGLQLIFQAGQTPSDLPAMLPLSYRLRGMSLRII
jgi:hypothetical protein